MEDFLVLVWLCEYVVFGMEFNCVELDACLQLWDYRIGWWHMV